MTNEVTITTNTVVTSLDVLKSVNDLYSSNFAQLLTVMGLLVGFGAVVLPLLFQYREAQIRKAQIESDFQSFKDEAKKDIEKMVREKFEAQQALAKKEIELLETRTNAAIVAAEVGVYHVQGNFELSEGRYENALRSYISALKRSIVAYELNKEEKSQLKVLQQNMRFIAESILPDMKKTDFCDEDIPPRVKDVIASSKKIECAGLLDREIKLFEKSFSDARSREAK